MKIFDYDASLFTKEALEESQRLVDKLKGIGTNTTEFDDEINEACIELVRAG